MEGKKNEWIAKYLFNLTLCILWVSVCSGFVFFFSTIYFFFLLLLSIWGDMQFEWYFSVCLFVILLTVFEVVCVLFEAVL